MSWILRSLCRSIKKVEIRELVAPYPHPRPFPETETIQLTLWGINSSCTFLFVFILSSLFFLSCTISVRFNCMPSCLFIHSHSRKGRVEEDKDIEKMGNITCWLKCTLLLPLCGFCAATIIILAVMKAA